MSRSEDVFGDNYALWFGDCLERLNDLPDGGIDLVLADMPYGTTACKWDQIIPMEKLWPMLKRVAKKNAAFVFTASQPFTTVLINSNPDDFKYEWIWEKNRPTNFAHAKNKPMKKHENILVFSGGTTVHASQSPDRMTYNPQGLSDIPPKKCKKSPGEKTKAFFADRPGHREFVRDKTGYPHSILSFYTEMNDQHPTQKPVDLMAYMIRTYSNPGEVVLDFTMGSGTTGVAALKEGRAFVGIDDDPVHFQTAVDRIAKGIKEIAA